MTTPDFPPCPGRPLYKHIDGVPVMHSGAYPYICTTCGVSGLAAKPREVCGLPSDPGATWLPITRKGAAP